MIFLAVHKYLIDQISMNWIHAIFQYLEDGMALEELVEIAEHEGIEFGKRRDVFNRLIDLNILEKYVEQRVSHLRWTSFGNEVRTLYVKSASKLPYLLHILQAVNAFNPKAKRYFTTYYYITDLLLEQENKTEASKVFEVLYSGLAAHYPDDAIEGIEKSTIGKSTVFLKEVLDENFTPLTFIDPTLMVFGIQHYIEMKTGERDGRILITAKERKELSNILLIAPSQFEQHLEKTNKYTKAFESRYSTSGTILNSLKIISL